MNGVRISLHGPSVTRKDIEKVGHHTIEMLKEIARLQTGDREAIQWSLTNIRFICDGCGRDRPEQHDDWHYAEGDDFCPECWGTTEEPKA